MEFSGFEEIAALDLEPIKRKIMHGKSGEDWPPERIAVAEREYRRFLLLMKKYPDELVAPTTEVDAFWHQHILDTAKYARDCQQVFGYFLHHYPYLGLLGEADAARRLVAGSRMRALYEQTFGPAEASRAEAAPSGDAFCAATKAEFQTAFCAVTSAVEGARSDVAFCAVTQQGNPSAFCAATSAASTTQMETAFCAAEAPRRECAREAALH
jgi:hypothetical protein